MIIPTKSTPKPYSYYAPRRSSAQIGREGGAGPPPPRPLPTSPPSHAGRRQGREERKRKKRKHATRTFLGTRTSLAPPAPRGLMAFLRDVLVALFVSSLPCLLPTWEGGEGRGGGGGNDVLGKRRSCCMLSFVPLFAVLPRRHFATVAPAGQVTRSLASTKACVFQGGFLLDLVVHCYILCILQNNMCSFVRVVPR